MRILFLILAMFLPAAFAGSCNSPAGSLIDVTWFDRGSSYCVEDDILIHIINTLMGAPTDNDVLGTWESSIPLMSSIFLKGLLMVGSILVAYSVLVSSKDTAIQGALLGKKNSAHIMILRNAFGIGMILPMSAGLNNGSLAPIQRLTWEAAIQGVNLGNETWQAYIQRPNLLSGQILVSKNARYQLMRSMKPVVMAEACVYLLKEHYAKRGEELNEKPNSATDNGYYIAKEVTEGGWSNRFPVKLQQNKANLKGRLFLDKKKSVDVIGTDVAGGEKKVVETDAYQVYALYGDYTPKGGAWGRDKTNSPDYDPRQLCGSFLVQATLFNELEGSDKYDSINPINENVSSSDPNSKKRQAYTASSHAKVKADLEKKRKGLIRIRNEIGATQLEVFTRLIKGQEQDIVPYDIVRGKLGSGSWWTPKNTNVTFADIAKKLIEVPQNSLEETESFKSGTQKQVQAATELIDDLSKIYVNNLVNNVKKLTLRVYNDDQLLEQMKKEGMASAGAYFWSIASTGASISDMISSPIYIETLVPTPRKSLPAIAGGYADYYQENYRQFEQGFRPLLADMDYISSRYDLAIRNLSNSIFKDLTGSKLEYNKELIKDELKNNESGRLIDAFIGDEVGALGQNDFLNLVDLTTSGSPLLAVHNLGKKGIWWFDGIFKNVTSGNFSGAAIAFILPLSIAILMPSIMMAFYIPLLPYILWVGSLFGWIVMFLLAIFGSPLLMLAHLIPDKDSFVGRQGQGYMMYLGFCLRPLLLIIGLVSAIELINPVGALVNRFFGQVAIEVVGGNGLLWLLGLCSVIVIYAMLLVNILKKIFALIHVIPDSLMQWFGSTEKSVFGEYAQSFEQGTQSGLQSVTGGLNGAAHGVAMQSRMAASNKSSSGNTNTISDSQKEAMNNQGMQSEGLFTQKDMTILSGVSSEAMKGTDSTPPTFTEVGHPTDKLNINHLGDSLSERAVMNSKPEFRQHFDGAKQDQSMYSNLPVGVRNMIAQENLKRQEEGRPLVTSWKDHQGQLHMVPTENSRRMHAKSFDNAGLSNVQILSKERDYALNDAKHGIHKQIYNTQSGKFE